MTTQNTHHNPNSVPAFCYPSPEEIRHHLARGKRMQAEAVGASIASAARRLSRSAGAAWRWLLARHQQAETRRALMTLSDRTLADIGIRREHIGLAARGLDPQPQRVDPQGLSWRDRWAAALERLDAAQRRRREQLRVYRELMDYSEQDLNDLGIARRDIPMIARSA